NGVAVYDFGAISAFQLRFNGFAAGPDVSNLTLRVSDTQFSLVGRLFQFSPAFSGFFNYEWETFVLFEGSGFTSNPGDLSTLNFAAIEASTLSANARIRGTRSSGFISFSRTGGLSLSTVSLQEEFIPPPPPPPMDQPTAVPLPASGWLLMAMLGFGWVIRRRKSTV
ncbi:MAG: VPLPA-CTERM sorting domain-containing protein, partial [Pseudomonadota bacterium]